eukprot:scaffold216697_cov34-Tisochrysis_lutea.AAC.1
MRQTPDAFAHCTSLCGTVVVPSGGRVGTRCFHSCAALVEAVLPVGELAQQHSALRVARTSPAVLAVCGALRRDALSATLVMSENVIASSAILPF